MSHSNPDAGAGGAGELAMTYSTKFGESPTDETRRKISESNKAAWVRRKTRMGIRDSVLIDYEDRKQARQIMLSGKGHYFDPLLENAIAAALTTVRKEAREAAFREAARDICVHCDQRATSHAAEVEGPNSAGNYIHKSKSVKADALCEATSIHARLRFEAVSSR